jgi:transposase
VKKTLVLIGYMVNKMSQHEMNFKHITGKTVAPNCATLSRNVQQVPGMAGVKIRTKRQRCISSRFRQPESTAAQRFS